MAEEIVQEKTSSKKNNYIYTIGRRKQASARVRLYQEIKSTYDFKKGDIIVNSKKMLMYKKCTHYTIPHLNKIANGFP